MRDSDEGRLLQRLAVVLAQYPVAQASSQGQDGFCLVHNVRMQENEKNGRRWFSHRLPDDNGWCKGKLSGR